MDENAVAKIVVDTAVGLHRTLGPGLLESVYEAALAHELGKRGMHAERQVAVPLKYDGITFSVSFRADLVVERKVLVELKCVANLDNAHRKQLLTYLRLTDLRLGLLLNFHEALMKDGIVRMVNNLK